MNKLGTFDAKSFDAGMANYTPPEVLEQICQHLETSDLKVVRSICRSFEPVAQKHLFKEVLIRSNLKSFQKPSYIARHHTLKHYVHKVVYDGMLFDVTYKSFDEWYKSVSGGIERRRVAGLAHDTTSQESSEQILPVELQYHFSQHRYYIECQRRVLANNDLKDWLSAAFKAFQNLEVIQFVTENTKLNAPTRPNPCGQDPRVENLSSIGRETLMEPTAFPSSHQKSHILVSLLKATRASEVKLKSIDCDWIPCSALSLLESDPDTFDEILSRLRELRLRVTFDDPIADGRQNCAKFIGKAMMLRTLHLETQKTITSRDISLKLILEHREHWPSLMNLKLRGIWTEWNTLQDFLTTHAHTLRSLELNDIILTADDTPWPQIAKASWVSSIQFLQKSLHLKQVRLEGRLFARREGWITHDDEYYQTRGELFVSDRESGNCLRKRIHRYILEGGECPFKNPSLVKPENQGDYSWKYTAVRHL